MLYIKIFPLCQELFAMRIEILEEKPLNLVCSCQVCPVVTIVHNTTAKEMKGVTLAHRGDWALEKI